MAAVPFVHLHCHTEYSLLDGAIRTKDLVRKAVEFGMPAVAITDHGNLYGAIEFYQAAERAGVRPIVGCEVYVAPRSLRDRNASSGKEAAFHLTLLAANGEGYRNLVKLVTAAHLEGFYYKPRVDKELLATHSRGIIALSGCLKGEINSRLLAGDSNGARQLAGQYREIFGRDCFFVELHDHGLEAQRRCNPELVRIARELDLGLVAANDVHFLEREHHESHDVMLCIGTASMVFDEKRMRYAHDLYFKSGEEMASLFRELPDALANTVEIAERCELKLEFGQPKYPAYEVPEGRAREEYFRELCWRGLHNRYGQRAETDQDLRGRLEYELSIIERTGFVSYFLIVWDFISYARHRGIPVGPGRGSAAGSLIAYALQITDIDPLRYGLIFERFLNPERISPPDIDVDFCMERRGEVIDYVRRKYGERCVSQIVTFGTLGAKSVVRDVGRVLGWSYTDADRLAKMIPNELNITLSSAAERNSELRTALDNEPATRQLWEHALILEGLSRNTGIHAAGVVIGDRELDEYVPLCRGKDNEVITQYEMNALTELGMLKMDFLGLKTLTVIEETVRMIRERNPEFDLTTIPTDDRPAFDIYNRGETVGVFQMEGGGITNCCRRFDVGSIEDIIAIGALYRPGPMRFIDDYIARKKGQKIIEYAHPLLEQVCSETYGIIVYQEQVQLAANVLAGYSLGEADLLRRAMGKKDREKMAKERTRFVDGCRRMNGIGAETANAIFDFIARFAEYGFNKSHSAAYGWVSYQTAYLKAHYPVEFMAALLTHDASTTDRIAEIIGECSRMGIKILAPDVNSSGLRFTPEADASGMAIRFGLASIKNVGGSAMRCVIDERDRGGLFQSLDDFCARLDSHSVNRKILESLVKCGAFDCFRKSRAQLFADLEHAISSAATLQRDRARGQGGLFDQLDSPTRASRPSVEPWSRNEMLAYERELLGFYLTGHPLEAFAGHFESPKITSIAAAQQAGEPSTVRLAGIVCSVEKKFTKKDGRPFAVIMLEDFTGQIELTAWDDVYTQHQRLLDPGAVLAISARLTPRDDGVRAIASKLSTLKPKASEKPVRLRLARTKLSERVLPEILEAVRRFPGKRPLIIEIVNDDGFSFEIRAGAGLAVGDENGLQAAVLPFAVTENPAS
ncbi:MAG TPA: DNA polymerase III subunit alpha [Terrimicrobiaceae bacterium]|nr:DNA polymerase III subunit alpha [Terrimicrobiaceae bacterium]